MFFLIVIVSLFFYYALSVKAFTDNATYLSDVGFLARVWAVLLLLGEFLFSFADCSLMILVLGSKFFTGDSTLFLFEGSLYDLHGTFGGSFSREPSWVFLSLAILAGVLFWGGMKAAIFAKVSNRTKAIQTASFLAVPFAFISWISAFLNGDFYGDNALIFTFLMPLF